MPTYDVIVGNVGTVYSGTSHVKAKRYFTIYKSQSRMKGFMASGEDVTIMRDNDIHKEYIGTLSQHGEKD